MRELTTLETIEETRRLVAYLAVQSVEASMDDDDGEWTVWVLNDDDREKALRIVEDYRQNPTDLKFENAERKVRSVLQEAERLAKQQNHSITRQHRIGKQWKRHSVTYVMIGLCILVSALCTNWSAMESAQFGLPALCNNRNSWLLEKLCVVVPVSIVKTPEGRDLYYYTMPELPDDLTNFTAVWSSLQGKASVGWKALSETVASGEIWRPVTPIFIHFGVAHIFFNMMWLKSLGEDIEVMRGRWRFLLLSLILAVASCLGQLFWNGPHFGGMSGVVFGLVGYVWMKGKTQPQAGLALEQTTVVYCFLWLFFCMSGAVGRIANAAHLVGFVTGILIGARHAIWNKIPFVK